MNLITQRQERTAIQPSSARRTEENEIKEGQHLFVAGEAAEVIGWHRVERDVTW